jgi:drug/metabolite transporter (DMT)-like permease
VLLWLHGGSPWDWTFVAVVVLQATFNAVAAVLVVRAVTLSPLALTVPYLGFTPVVITGVAALVLQETPHLQGLLGLGFVVIGAVALHAGNNFSFRALLTAPLREPGSWRMLLVATIWGTTTPLSKIAIRHGSELLLACCLPAAVAILLAGAWWGGVLKDAKPKELGRQTGVLLCAAALATAGALLFEFLAYRELLVAYVETIRRSGSVLSVIAGAVVFKEERLSRRLPAAALMVLGVALVLLR